MVNTSVNQGNNLITRVKLKKAQYELDEQLKKSNAFVCCVERIKDVPIVKLFLKERVKENKDLLDRVIIEYQNAFKENVECGNIKNLNLLEWYQSEVLLKKNQLNAIIASYSCNRKR